MKCWGQASYHHSLGLAQPNFIAPGQGAKATKLLILVIAHQVERMGRWKKRYKWFYTGRKGIEEMGGKKVVENEE